MIDDVSSKPRRHLKRFLLQPQLFLEHPETCRLSWASGVWSRKRSCIKLENAVVWFVRLLRVRDNPSLLVDECESDH